MPLQFAHQSNSCSGLECGKILIQVCINILAVDTQPKRIPHNVPVNVYSCNFSSEAGKYLSLLFRTCNSLSCCRSPM